MRLLVAATLVGQDAAPQGAPKQALEAEGPAQLLERGRAAFSANDFAGAEAALEKFIADYGEAEEAKEAARLHRPLVALSKVGLGKLDEAIGWIEESLADPEIEPTLADELRFWRAICLTSVGELVPAQRAFGEYWANESHNAFKRYEALLLFGTLYLQQEFPEEAADFFESQLDQVREASPEAAGRAVVLELHARLVSGQLDKALAVVRREHPNLGAMTQVVSFQSLALQLGSTLLEEGRLHDAISCLQRIWPRERLLEHQRAKSAEIAERIALLEQRPNTQGTVFQLKAILRRVERELENFAQIEHFDSALRLRLALAFQSLSRYREAALVLEEMVATLPPDPVVESAALAQVQCWMETRHWVRAVEAAGRYEKVFGTEGKSLPLVLFLKAEALRENLDPGAAQLAYGALVERFPDHDMAGKATFMQGFLYLQQDDTDGALYQFEQVRRQYPESGLLEDADYWTGMAYSFAGLYAEAREHLAGYLSRYKPPKYRKEATFRIAVCTFSLAEYAEAIANLEAFVEAYPGDPLCDEANLLLGDAFFGEGLAEEGFAAYERVRPESGRFFEDAWFKKGNALKLLEEIPAMREHFERFVADFPASGRLPEAVYWIGWTHLQEGRPDEAREIYWRTVEEHGDDDERHTMADLLVGLPKVYAAEGDRGREELLAELHGLKVRSAAAGRATLALRAAWARAMLLGGAGSEEGRADLVEAAKWLDPRRHEPAVTVPVAEARLAGGARLAAKELFAEIRRWHPRAVERDRIYRALGDIAAAEGEPDRAIEFYERFERETAQSVHLGEVRMRMAQLHEEAGRPGQARETLERTLETAGVGAAQKAEVLLRLGDSLAREGRHEKAAVYYERLYVAYGKFAELNAKAYWRRGQSLEKLSLRREALETYEELVAREELRSYEEAKRAGERAADLRREFPREETAPEGKEATG